jgi:hypothetical protein
MMKRTNLTLFISLIIKSTDNFNYAKSILRMFSTRSQFHQHIMSSFCANILTSKSTNLKCKYKKAALKTFFYKESCLYNDNEIDTWAKIQSLELDQFAPMCL